MPPGIWSSVRRVSTVYESSPASAAASATTVVNEAELVCEAVLDCLGPEVRIGVSDLVAVEFDLIATLLDHVL